MTVYFAGGELSAFTPSVNCVEAPAGYDAAYSRIAIGWNTSASATEYAYAKFVDPATNLFTNLAGVFSVSAAYKTCNYNTAADCETISFENNVGQVVLKLLRHNGGTYELYYWNGSTFVTTGSSVVLAANNLYYITIVGVCAAGATRIYINGSPSGAIGAIASASMNNIAAARLYVGGNGVGVAFGQDNGNWSQVIVANEATVGWRYYTKVPTSNSATNTAWTGTFTDVDEAVTNDGDFAESTVAGDIDTYLGAAIALPGNVAVKCVNICTRVRITGAGPQNLQHALRIGAANYFSPNVSGLDVGYTGQQSIFMNDPSTGIPWTTPNAGAATLEFGYKSIA